MQPPSLFLLVVGGLLIILNVKIPKLTEIIFYHRFMLGNILIYHSFKPITHYLVKGCPSLESNITKDDNLKPEQNLHGNSKKFARH
jgi:hypothetical protein